MEDSSWLTGLRTTIDSLTVGKWEEMNHVRGLLGIPAEDFETLLTIITKSTSSHLRFNVLDIEVELSKIIDDQLEVKIVMENPKGEATVRFQFNGTECKSLIL